MALPLSSSFSIFSLFMVFNVIITPTSSLLKSWKPDKPVPFFIFGDSFLDPGNNNYINTTTLEQANFWPYGETFFRFPTGRFSDGRLISDFIAEYAELPLIPPFLQPGTRWYYHGVNFASGGAGALAETYQGEVIALKTQLNNYQKVEKWLTHKLGNGEAKRQISRSVFLIGIGSNDYLSPFLTNSTVLNSFPESQYVEMVIGNLTQVIKEIYKNGGRNFAFINVPPLGCMPIMRIMRPENNGNCLKEVSSLAKLHNEALSKVLLQLEKELKGFKYSLFDFNKSLTQIINHPSKYGFKEGKAACCGTGEYRGVYSCGGTRPPVKEFQLCENPNEYVFWDSVHLTEMTHKQLAEQMWNGAKDPYLVGPYNLKQLFQQIH